MMYSKVHIVAVCLLLVQTVLQSAHGVRLNDVSSQQKLAPRAPSELEEVAYMRKYLKKTLKRQEMIFEYGLKEKDEKLVAELKEIKKKQTELSDRFEKLEKEDDPKLLEELKKFSTEFYELVAKPTHDSYRDFAERSEKSLRAVISKELNLMKETAVERLGKLEKGAAGKITASYVKKIKEQTLARLEKLEETLAATPYKDLGSNVTAHLDDFDKDLKEIFGNGLKKIRELREEEKKWRSAAGKQLDTIDELIMKSSSDFDRSIKAVGKDEKSVADLKKQKQLLETNLGFRSDEIRRRMMGASIDQLGSIIAELEQEQLEFRKEYKKLFAARSQTMKDYYRRHPGFFSSLFNWITCFFQ